MGEPFDELTVLWNRADGYILNTDGQRTDWHFRAPGVWVDPWPTKTPLTVAAGNVVHPPGDDRAGTEREHCGLAGSGFLDQDVTSCTR